MPLGFRSYFLAAVAAFFLMLPLFAQESQVPQVPPVIRFANMTLHLTEQAQRDIQSDVDALYRSPKYFFMKLERVDMYLPIIEPIFAEYGIPDDIKYLVIQESALISDAVSSSNAVGFWQFKETSATELGMRVDRHVDERMNIVASTVGAAKYLLRSNANFNNWLYSLQSYQMGLGGATRALSDRYYGANEMRIDGDTYWYVKKFLSHLIAFRDAVGKQPRSLMLYQLKNTANKKLEEIAHEFDADPAQLEEYNKWLKTNRVPDDRPYVVIIPVQLEEAPDLLAESQSTSVKKQQKNSKRLSLEDKLFGQKQKEPEIPAAVRDELIFAEVNGIPAIVARAGDNARELAKLGNLSVASFLKYNDIKPGDPLVAGQVYYLKKKKKRASVYRHVVAEGESLWDISQKYGLRMDKLLQKNRMKEKDGVKPGQVIWLRYIRPANEPVAFEEAPAEKSSGKQAAAGMPVKSVQTTSARSQAAVPEVRQQEKVPVLQAAVPVQQTPQPVAQKKEAPAKKRQPEQAQDTTVESASLRENKQAPVQAAVLVEQADTSKISLQQTVVYPADTPVAKPAAVKVQPQTKAKENTKPATDSMHLYPGSGASERNVSAQKSENREVAGKQVVDGAVKSEVDSFGVRGPVKFIGADGKAEETLPLTPAAAVADTATAPKQRSAAASQQVSVTNAPAAQQAVKEQKPAATPKDTVHIVQAGETLYSISKRYGLSVEDLKRWNNMADPTLSIGQALRLSAGQKATGAAPAAAEASLNTAVPANVQDSPYVYHTVAEGETMYRVARKYNVTIKDIMELNRREDFNIRPGEVLIVGRK